MMMMPDKKSEDHHCQYVSSPGGLEFQFQKFLSVHREVKIFHSGPKWSTVRPTLPSIQLYKCSFIPRSHDIILVTTTDPELYVTKHNLLIKSALERK